jgi:plastocyanin
MTGGASMAFFPKKVDVHVGDSIVFVQNSVEIHTVTFGGDTKIPPLLSPMPGSPSKTIITQAIAWPTVPKPSWNGKTFANSGIMSTGIPGLPVNFTMVFGVEGTFNYTCVVHGEEMTGFVTVKSADKKILSPAQVDLAAKVEIAIAKVKIASAQRKAKKLSATKYKPVKNADGSKNYTVLVGYAKGQVDLMSFSPNKVHAKVGDWVKFYLPPQNDAPHTITFLNGAPIIPIIVVQPGPKGQPPYLVLNPAALQPYNAGKPLMKTGIFSSGFLSETAPDNMRWYSLKLAEAGEYDFLCLLHVGSGMRGHLTVEAPVM